VQENETTETRGPVKLQIEKTDVNIIDAAGRGTAEGLHLAMNVGAMLISFVALISLINGILGTVGLSTLQSRALAGQVDDTFIFCLPGSTGACRDGWDLVLAQELDSRYRPCSLAGQIPRLRHLCT
jgi:hypothetical protein